MESHSDISSPSSFLLAQVRGLSIRSRAALFPETTEQLADAIKRASVERAAPLEGRGVSIVIPTKQFGGVFLKQYRRGGLMRWIAPSWYFGTEPKRVIHEFVMLEAAQRAGVRVPRPIAVISEGWALYRGWLAIEECAQASSIASFVAQHEEAIEWLGERILEQLFALIEAKIFHLDLHPGNMLVGPDRTVWVIDFDKARHFHGSKNQLRDRYLTRWRRAVIKHRLPESLTEAVAAGLRRFFHDEHHPIGARIR